jgi:hypothetical protein
VRQSKKKQDDRLDHALAVLIANTRSTKRPLPLTEVAKSLDVIVKELGGYSAAADRLGLSTKMLRQFSYVYRLSPTVQQLVATRKIDSVDAVTHLAMLPRQHQEVVARALSNNEIAISDIRSIVQLQRMRKSSPIEKILDDVRRGKKRREYIAEFVVRGSRDNPGWILKAFQKFISPKEILRVEFDGALGRLVLSPLGRQELVRASRELGVSIERVIPKILEG